jgi:hypothetical protein
VVNTDHSVTALVSNTLGNPVAGVTVNFVVSSGPNATVGSPPLAVVTDANGMAVFSYTGSNGTGADSIAASFNSGATVVTATPVSVTWITVPAAITLSPDAVTLVVGNNHTVTAQVTDTLGAPAANVTVGFNVNSGPNAGISAQAVTDAGGRATFTYTGINGPGTDTIGASLVAGNTTVTATPVTVIWELAAAIVIPTLAPLALVLMLAMLGMAGALVLRRKA